MENQNRRIFAYPFTITKHHTDFFGQRRIAVKIVKPVQQSGIVGLAFPYKKYNAVCSKRELSVCFLSHPLLKYVLKIQKFVFLKFHDPVFNFMEIILVTPSIVILKQSVSLGNTEDRQKCMKPYFMHFFRIQKQLQASYRYWCCF